MGKVSIIVAAAGPRDAYLGIPLPIGNKGQLLYHISADLKRFKALTTGHTIVMGRKTYESLPKGPLPNRRNIVVTRDASYPLPAGAERATSLAEALYMASADGHIYIIGGGEIYRQAMDLTDEVELTLIHPEEAPEADTFVTIPADFTEVAAEEATTTPAATFIRLARR